MIALKRGSCICKIRCPVHPLPFTLDVKSSYHHQKLSPPLSLTSQCTPLSLCCCWEEAGCIAWKQKVGDWSRTRGGQERCEGHMKWHGGPDSAHGPCVWHLGCSPSFFKCLLIVHLETATPHVFRESCISPEVICGFFFASQTIFQLWLKL